MIHRWRCVLCKLSYGNKILRVVAARLLKAHGAFFLQFELQC
jgi:hypothetical protein